ncbi:TetR/AcrR family transcriptional regulator [Desulfotignum balticum]|uniref:TetR/AcrR family transcriptional regulator n=1 Tax=Desulfotignum balticum TaxID=115781 RepID=UPI0003FF6980|nr:TetR/AcrR family transcriptional regulator [Desulfotignum balticum]
MKNKNNTTEETILKKSLRLFVRKGYHGTSINDIMVEVGLTKGAFYSHFDSKGDLFLRLIEMFRDQFFDTMITQINEYDGNSLEKIHQIFNFLAKFGKDHTDLCVFLTFLSPELNTDIDFESELRRIYIDYQQFISRLIKQGIEEKVIKKELNPDLTALTFMALNDGVFNHWWRLNQNQLIDGEAYLQTFSSIFIEGIRS